jgi:hypothetical protein
MQSVLSLHTVHLHLNTFVLCYVCCSTVKFQMVRLRYDTIDSRLATSANINDMYIYNMCTGNHVNAPVPKDSEPEF